MAKTFRSGIMFFLKTGLLLLAYDLFVDLAETAGMHLLGVDPYVGAVVGDVFALACVAPLVVRYLRKGPGWEPVMKEKFSPFGLGVIFMVLVVMYVAVEMTGLWLGYAFPTVGSTEAYTSMSDTQLYMYVIRSFTVVPFIEEIAARLIVFKRVREREGFWLAVTLSTVYFIFLHGTVMHVPLSIGVTFLNCTLYEATGKFRSCVILHMLFNLLGTTVIFSVDNFPVVYRFVLLGIAYLFLVLLYVFREKLFTRVLCVSAVACMESFLDKELDKLVDEAGKFGTLPPKDGENAGAVQDADGGQDTEVLPDGAVNGSGDTNGMSGDPDGTGDDIWSDGNDAYGKEHDEHEGDA